MFWFLSSMSLIIDPLIFFKCLEKKTYPVSYGLVMPAPRQGSDIQNQTLLTCRHVLFQNLRMFCLLPSFTALPSHLPFLVLFNCLPPDATLEFPLVLSFSVLVCLNMSDFSAALWIRGWKLLSQPPKARLLPSHLHHFHEKSSLNLTTFFFLRLTCFLLRKCFFFFFA